MNRATAPRLTLVVGVVILLGLLYQPVAGAAPPLTETFTETFDGVQSCDGFQNVFSGEISLRVTTYFDAAESPSRVQIHATGEEIDVNSITGKSISIRGNSSWLLATAAKQASNCDRNCSRSSPTHVGRYWSK